MRCRWLAKQRAKAEHKFWLPCPVCGDNFAGFESGQWGVTDSYGSGRSVCCKLECQIEAKRQTREFYAKYDEGVYMNNDPIPEPHAHF